MDRQDFVEKLYDEKKKAQEDLEKATIRCDKAYKKTPEFFHLMITPASMREKLYTPIKGPIFYDDKYGTHKIIGKPKIAPSPTSTKGIIMLCHEIASLWNETKEKNQKAEELEDKSIVDLLREAINED